MSRVEAPIATEQDRRAVAWIVCRIRHDWKPASVATILGKASDQQLDRLAVSAIIAAVTRTDQTTPALLGMDGGEHQLRALNALSDAPTPAPSPARRYAADPPCDDCNLPQSVHPFHGHDWQPRRTFTPATPDMIAAARATIPNFAPTLPEEDPVRPDPSETPPDSHAGWCDRCDSRADAGDLCDQCAADYDQQEEANRKDQP